MLVRLANSGDNEWFTSRTVQSELAKDFHLGLYNVHHVLAQAEQLPVGFTHVTIFIRLCQDIREYVF